MFAVVGDYGIGAAGCVGNVDKLRKAIEQAHGVDIEFIATAGDNDYWDGSCSSMHENIGQWFGDLFTPGDSCTDPSAANWNSADRLGIPAKPKTSAVRIADEHNAVLKPAPRASDYKFFPSLGNHDWDTYNKYGQRLPYLQYFNYLTQLPPNIAPGQFYTASPIPGVIDLFALNSNLAKTSADNYKALFIKQNQWLQQALGNSTAMYKIVYFHHPAHSTAQHDPLVPQMDLPFKEWGATLVIAGHQHVYERLEINGLTYLVNGLGGHPWRYQIDNCDIYPGSVLRYNTHHGLLVGAVQDNGNTTFCFYSTENGGKLVDRFN